jgi:hypothetical protein
MKLGNQVPVRPIVKDLGQIMDVFIGLEEFDFSFQPCFILIRQSLV